MSEAKSPATPASGFSGDIIKHLDSVEAQGAGSGKSINETLLDMIFEEVAEQKRMISLIDVNLRSQIEPVSLVGDKIDGIGQRLGYFEHSFETVDQLIVRYDAIEQRLVDIAGSVQPLGRSTEKLDAIDQRVSNIARSVEPVGQIIGRLDTIDRRVTAIEQRLPRPPSGLRLAAAIAAVLAIGVAAGVLLNHLQSAQRAADARTASLTHSQ